MVFLGLDPGTHTGVAVWDGACRRFTEIKTLPLHAALEYVKQTAAFYSFRNLGVKVVFEDARLRTWYGRNTAAKDRARLQGAGSVKRDCTIWEDALKDWGIDFVKVAPKNNLTKLSDEAFRRLTGWEKKTNEHGRDAAMLVFGR